MNKKPFKQKPVFLLALIVGLLAGGQSAAGWMSEQGVPTTQKLRAISGSAETAVFAVGDSGTIIRYDGTTWQNIVQITEKTIYSVWCASAEAVFAVADKGRIFFFDGSDWIEQDSGTTERLRAVWGASASEVFAAGENGTLLSFDGIAWSAENSPTPFTLQNIWGTSSTDVFAVGGPSGSGGVGDGVIVHYDGDEWRVVLEGVTPRLKAICGTAEGALFVVGDDGVVITSSGEPDTWEIIDSGTSESLKGVWSSPGNAVYAVGDAGTILQYEGTAWETADSGTSVDLFGVWGATPEDVFAVGAEGTVLRYDGQTGDNASSDCPFLVSLHSRDDIRLLRSLRDSRLDTGPGRAVAALFYAQAAEAAAILRCAPDLQRRLRHLVSANRDVLETLEKEGRAKIDAGRLREVSRFLEDIRQRGSAGFRASVSMVLYGIKSRLMLGRVGLLAD